MRDVEEEATEFDAERLSPAQERNRVTSLEYWARASVRWPLLAEVARRTLCVPASSATSERSFSKDGHIVRARRARLSDEHIEQLSFLSWNADLV